MKQDPATSSATIAITLRQALLLAIALLVLFVIGRVFLILFAAYLISIMLRTAAAAIDSRLKCGPNFALTAVLLAVLLAVAGTLWLAGASLATQVDLLTSLGPESLARITGWLRNYGWGQYILEQAPAIAKDQSARLIGLGSVAASGLFEVVGNILIAALIGIYLAAQPSLYQQGLIRLWPAAKRDRAEQVLTEVETVLARWTGAQAAAMALIGVTTGVGLYLIGIPSAALLGLITGLVNFIPNLGPIIAGIPTLLMALPEGGVALLMALALITVIQIVEGYFVTPLLEQHVVDLPPAITLAFQIGLGIVAGGLGFALAAPLAAVAITLIRELYVLPVADKS